MEGQQLKDRALALGLFMVTFGVWFNIPANKVRMLLFLMLTALVFIMDLPSIIKCMLLLAIFHTGFATVAYTTKMTKLANLKYNLAFESTLYIFAGVVLLNVLMKVQLKATYTALMICGLILIFHWFLQGIEKDVVFRLSSYGRKGCFSPWWRGSFLMHPNYLAAFLALSLPFFLEKWFWAFPLVGVALIAQRTTTALIAGFVGIYVWAYLKDRLTGKSILYMVSGFLIFLIFQQIFIDSYTNQLNRLEAWFGFFKHFTPFGAGLGAGVIYTNIVNIQSELLLWMYETGLVGLALAMWLGLEVIFTILEKRVEPVIGAAAGALMVLCLGTIPFRVPALALVGIIVLSQVFRERSIDGFKEIRT